MSTFYRKRTRGAHNNHSEEITISSIEVLTL